MNKQERKLKGNFKYIKRLKNIRLTGGVHYHVYKTTGTPCSCAMCSPGNAKINGQKKKEKKEFELAFI